MQSPTLGWVYKALLLLRCGPPTLSFLVVQPSTWCETQGCGAGALLGLGGGSAMGLQSPPLQSDNVPAHSLACF